MEQVERGHSERSSHHASHYSHYPGLSHSSDSFPGPAQQQSTQASGPSFIQPSQPQASLPYQPTPSSSGSLCSRSEPSRASHQWAPYTRLGSTSGLNESFSFIDDSSCEPGPSRAEQVEDRDDGDENEAKADNSIPAGPSIQEKCKQPETKKTKPRDPKKDLAWWKKNATPQRYELVKLMHSLLGFYLRKYFFPIFHPPGQPKSGAFPHTTLIEETRYIYRRLNPDCPEADIPSAFFFNTINMI